MSRPTRLRTLAVFLGIVVAVVAISIVRANDQGSCPNPATPGNSVRVWENTAIDGSDGNDTWYAICHRTAPTGYGSLRTVEHTLPGNCHGAIGEWQTWNDCIDQATVWLASPLWKVCFYQDTNYRNLTYWIAGPESGSRWALSGHDTISSIWLTNTGVCP